ncbi:MAG: 30S ribosomal protein S16 [Pseudomonadota bacterium]
MAVKLRLSRGGSKKRPFYRIVAADERAPRDGRFLEKLGTYNPMLPKDHESRVIFDAELVKKWLKVGAIPTDRVARFLEAAGITKAQNRNNPNKAQTGKKRSDRAEEKAAKLAAANEAEAEPEAAAEEAPAEESTDAAPEAEA